MDLKMGDVMLCNYAKGQTNPLIMKILDMQQKLDRGKATHVAIYAGNNKWLESGWKGAVFSDMSYGLDNPNYAILRWKDNIDENKMHKIISKYYEGAKDLGYSYLGLLSAAISTVIGYAVFILTAGKVEWKPVLIKEEKAPFCSELVAEIYEEYLGTTLSKIKNDVITPNDLYRMNRFEAIQDFKEEN